MSSMQLLYPLCLFFDVLISLEYYNIRMWLSSQVFLTTEFLLPINIAFDCHEWQMNKQNVRLGGTKTNGSINDTKLSFKEAQSCIIIFFVFLWRAYNSFPFCYSIQAYITRWNGGCGFILFFCYSAFAKLKRIKE